MPLIMKILDLMVQSNMVMVLFKVFLILPVILFHLLFQSLGFLVIQLTLLVIHFPHAVVLRVLAELLVVLWLLVQKLSRGAITLCLF